MSDRFVTSSVKSALPVLIVDRNGMLGFALTEKLTQFTQVVFASHGSEHSLASTKNFLHLPFFNVLSGIPQDAYSHIFFVPESEKDVRDLLVPFAQKANGDNSRFVVVVSKTWVTQKIIDYIGGVSPGAAIIVIGDLFSAPFSGRHLPLDTLLHQIKIKKSILLKNMGLEKRFPIEFTDAIAEILKISFGAKVIQGIYLVYPQHPATELGIVRAIQKLDPLIKLDFNHDPLPEIDIRSTMLDGTAILGQEYDPFQRIQEAFAAKMLIVIPDENANDTSEQELLEEPFWSKKSKKKREQKHYLLSFLTVFIVTLLLLLVISPIVAFNRGLDLFSQAKTMIEKGNLDSAQKNIVRAESLLLFSGRAVRLIGLTSISDQIDRTIDLGDIASQAVQSIQEFSSGRTDGENASALLADSALRLENMLKTNQLPAQIKSDLLGKEDSIALVADSARMLPDLLGFDRQKKYLILFQNNMELRPGGGFIGSYALATIQNAQLRNISVNDVYDADGQLKGHIEPPYEIRRYIPIAHLFLRDSNTSPDFPKDASTAAIMLNRETGDAVDGVIAVDLSFAKDVIGAIGGVYVAAYNTTVTKDNFFTLAQAHAEKNFFPGSTQKQDFLKNVFQAMRDKLETKTKINFGNLFDAVIQGVRQKHLLFVSPEKGLQDLLTADNYSSALWDGRSRAANIVNDFVGISEENLGINKVNYFISRSVTQNMQINQDGKVFGKLTIVYKNTSDGTWPGGEYKNYLRIILPKNTLIQNIALNDVTQHIVPAVTDFLVYEKPNFTPPNGLEVNQTQENGKNIIGFLVIVPKLSQEKISISYLLSDILPMNVPVVGYNLLYFKQPGTEVYPYLFSLSFPSGYEFLNGSPGIVPTGGSAQLYQELSTDTNIALKLTKK